MPAVKNVGEPCAGEPHARFDGGREETSDSRQCRATPGASRLPDTSSYRRVSGTCWGHKCHPRVVGSVVFRVSPWAKLARLRSVRPPAVRVLVRRFHAGISRAGSVIGTVRSLVAPRRAVVEALAAGLRLSATCPWHLAARSERHFRVHARLSGNSSGRVGSLCAWARGSSVVTETRNS
jgi:hypothetical protein